MINDLAPLTEQEMIALQYHEQVIERGLDTFIEVGQSLMAIRDQRLYRQTHKTFEEYVTERWGMRKSQAYHIIAASKVAENLSTMVDKLPESERQIRPLTKLDDPEDQRRAWEMAVERARQEERKVTAKLVEEAVAKVKAELEQERARARELEEALKRQPDVSELEREIERLREEIEIQRAEFKELEEELAELENRPPERIEVPKIPPEYKTVEEAVTAKNRELREKTKQLQELEEQLKKAQHELEMLHLKRLSTANEVQALTHREFEVIACREALYEVLGKLQKAQVQITCGEISPALRDEAKHIAALLKDMLLVWEAILAKCEPVRTVDVLVDVPRLA